jgi:hypothetical protein
MTALMVSYEYLASGDAREIPDTSGAEWRPVDRCTVVTHGTVETPTAYRSPGRAVSRFNTRDGVKDRGRAHRHRTCSRTGRSGSTRSLHGPLRHRLLVGVAVCLWIGVTATRLVNAGPPRPQQTGCNGGTGRSTSCPVAAGVMPVPTPARSATPITRRTSNARGYGQVAHPRSPAAAHGCETCHGPGQAHVDDESKGISRNSPE